MRFTCCLNMGFDLKLLKLNPNLFVWQYTKSVAARTDHYFEIFVREKDFLFAKNVVRVMTLWQCYDVRKFNADAILFGENQCKKNDIIRFYWCFQWVFCWNHVKYARITITHVCFISLTFGSSLGRCLNTWPDGLLFKQLPRDPTRVMHEKTCVIPIILASTQDFGTYMCKCRILSLLYKGLISIFLCLQLRVVHNLMCAMGNMDYADSQRQSSISLEVCMFHNRYTYSL